MVTTLNPFIALVWPVAMVFSPEALAMLGNMAGRYGILFLIPLAGAWLLHGLNIAVGPWFQATPQRGLSLGALGATLRSLIALPAVAVCLATATLVTSGYVFNEVFVYWFPNFGFAALLLFVLLVVNLTGPRTAAVAQALLTTTALSGLLVLVLAGLVAQPAETLEASTATGRLDMRSLGLAALAFLGYDLIRYMDADIVRRRARNIMLAAIAIGGLIVWAWNTTALAHVSPSRLAETGIPHILAAKAIMGQSGRVIMGIVVIAGSLAATNLLLQAVTRMMAGMAQTGSMPTWPGFAPARPWLPLFALIGMSGLLMALGFAGSDWLDITLRAGLILWLAGIGLEHLSPLVSGRGRNRDKTARFLGRLALLLGMPTLGIVLIMTDPNPGMLVRALSALVAVATLLAMFGLVAAGRRPTRRHLKASHSKEGVLQ